MPNINLKYLIAGVIILSVLMILGSVLFSYLYYKPYYDYEPKSQNQLPVNFTEQTPKITVTYPAGQATKSSTPTHKPAQIPKIGIASGGSTAGSGSIRKDIPKP